MTTNPIAATAENFSLIQQMVAQLQGTYVRELRASQSEARILAAEEIGKQLAPPMTGKELESWMGKQRSLLSAAAPREAREDTVVARYRAWAESNDFIPADTALAHFDGHTRNAFGQARATLRDEGYKFERVETGWIVTDRPRPEPEPAPAPRVYTEDEVLQMFKDFISKGGKS